jgi:hypothetical protein
MHEEGLADRVHEGDENCRGEINAADAPGLVPIEPQVAPPGVEAARHPLSLTITREATHGVSEGPPGARQCLGHGLGGGHAARHPRPGLPRHAPPRHSSMARRAITGAAR